MHPRRPAALLRRRVDFRVLARPRPGHKLETQADRLQADGLVLDGRWRCGGRRFGPATSGQQHNTGANGDGAKQQCGFHAYLPEYFCCSADIAWPAPGQAPVCTDGESKSSNRTTRPQRLQPCLSPAAPRRRPPEPRSWIASPHWRPVSACIRSGRGFIPGFCNSRRQPDASRRAPGAPRARAPACPQNRSARGRGCRCATIAPG